MKLEGSCHCGAVRYSVETHHPQPSTRCYCSICRKAGGGGGYGINLGAESKTLAVDGQDNVRVYRAKRIVDGVESLSSHERHFCSLCGCHLWAFNSTWPDHLHPVASSVDSPLPSPVSHRHMMVGSKASWVEVEGAEGEPQFDGYPDRSLAKWHEEHKVVVD